MYLRTVGALALLVYFAAGLSAAENRIIRRAGLVRPIPLRGQSNALPRSQFDRGPADAAMQLGSVTLFMKPASGLEELLADQQNPASPQFRKWLTPEEFAERFGLSDGDIDEVTLWAGQQGLRVERVARGRHWITVSGSVERVNRAFGTEIRRFDVNGAVHYANSIPPSVPEFLATVVDGVAGLTDFGVASRALKPQFTAGNHRYIVPDDFATIYGTRQLLDTGYDGRGQSIAVIGRTAIELADVRDFRARFNLPYNDPKLVLAGKDPGRVSDGDVIEANLDLQWAGAVAPNANIIYVYATDIMIALQHAVDQNVAPIISLSYGGCEQTHGAMLRYLAQQASAQGITWLAASGDWGAAACDLFSPVPRAQKGLAVAWPANLPEVTGVGGTRLEGSGAEFWSATNNPNGGSALSYIPERAWNDAAERGDLSAGGGEASSLFTRPVWQTGAGVPKENARSVPDVAFASSPQFGGYQVVIGGNAVIIGGTSVATPAFAGILALVNQYLIRNEVLQGGLGNVNPMLYRLAQTSKDVFHDVTAGDNRVPCAPDSPNCDNGTLGHATGPGYDLATGLGSVDAYKLATQWMTAPATRTTVTAMPNNPNLDEMVELSATVRGNGETWPTGTVTFSTGGASLGTVELPVTGIASMQISAFAIGAGSGVVSAVYSGDAIFNGSAVSATTTLTLPASGSAVIPSITPNPVYQTSAGWLFTVRLLEKAGVSTRLTNFLIDDAVAPVTLFGSEEIPAKGSVSATLLMSEAGVSQNRVLSFSGVDADGKTWTRRLTVQFLGPAPPQ